MLEFEIPLNPVPASRPRVTRGGWSYVAEPYKSFKEELTKWCREYWAGRPLIDYRVIAEVIVWKERPKTSKLVEPKPDIDNFLKGVFDGMNGTILVDDSLIHRGSCEKFWAEPGEPGKVSVKIERYE